MSFGSNVGDVLKIEARERAAQESRCEAVRAETHLLAESGCTVKIGGRPARRRTGRGRIKGSPELLGLTVPEKLQVGDFPGKMMNSIFDIC